MHWTGVIDWGDGHQSTTSDTDEDRKRARQDLMWRDHGVLRQAFHNFHWIDARMAIVRSTA